MRTDENLQTGIKINLFGNYLRIYEDSKEILKVDLNKFDGIMPVSIPENKKAAEMAALSAFSRYADNEKIGEVYLKRLNSKRKEEVRSVAQGAFEYIEDLNIRTLGKRHLDIALQGNKLEIFIDHKPVIVETVVNNLQAGKIALEAVWGGHGWSQRNLADDVYDAVFEETVIRKYNSQASLNSVLKRFEYPGKRFILNNFIESDDILYAHRKSGWEGFKLECKALWETLVEWAMYLF